MTGKYRVFEWQRAKRRESSTRFSEPIPANMNTSRPEMGAMLPYAVRGGIRGLW
jgi:hypothetical protein